MKIRLNNLFLSGIFLQIISTQGVFTFLIFKFLGDWKLKAILHPLSFVIILFAFILKRFSSIKITSVDFLMLLYSIFLFFILITNYTSVSGIYLSSREIFFLPLLTYVYHNSFVNREIYDKILQVLLVFIIVNLVFIFLTFYMGPEDFMTSITGRYQWGIDEDYKFQISVFLKKFWRSPGIVGSSGAMAYFAFLSFVLMDGISKYRFKKWIAFILLFFTFTRSALLAFFIYWALTFFLRKENFSKLILLIKVGIPIIGLIFIVLNYYNFLSLKSFFIRLDVWFNRIQVDYNLLYGGAIGNLGGAVRGEGMIAVIDSYWLMMLYSAGLLGIILWVTFFYEKAIGSNKVLICCLSLIIAGFFVTFTQAITFLVLFPILFLKVEKLK